MKDCHQKVILVLGGNAFTKPGEALTMAAQFRFAAQALRRLTPLFEAHRQVVITHGNGPQVGHILTRVEEALGKAYAIPLEVCVAESEGELGYVLQQSLYNVLHEIGRPRPIVGVLTQVVVDIHDPAFKNPTKPIGPFYSEAAASHLRRRGFTVCEDAGRGYRRVVPSPTPHEIIEIDVIRQLIEQGVIVVAAGGGGIPVTHYNGGLVGVEAVVDKDLASAVLGEAIGATFMLILTCTPCAYRHYGTERQEPIGVVSAKQAAELIGEGHFAAGSMKPKMEAAVRFVSRPGATAIICDLESAQAALEGKAGTIVQFE